MSARISEDEATSKSPGPWRTVWRLAWPTIGEQCLQLMVGLNEVFLLGHLSKEAAAKLGYDSATALGSANLGQFYIWVMLACFNGVGIATTALVARSVGAGQHDRASFFARHGIALALGFGLLMSGIMILCADLLTSLIGAEGQLQQTGSLFIRTMAFGIVFQSLLVGGNACLRGSGDTRTPLVIMIIVNGVNVTVAWLFINGQFGLPTLGVQGAALGAVISWAVGATLVMSRLLFGMSLGRSARKLRIKLSWRLDLATLRTMLGQALPTIGEQWTFQIGIFIFSRMLIGQGTSVYAAHNTVITIDSISFLPGIGLGIANTVLVGQSLGAGKPEQAQLYVWTAYKIGLLFMTSMGLMFFFFPEFFLQILVVDPKIIEVATPALRVAGIFDPLVGTAFIFMGALRGAGDNRFPMFARFISSVLFRVSLGFLFMEILHLSLFGARLAMGLDTALLSALIIWRFRTGKWKTIFIDRAAHKADKLEGKAAARLAAHTPAATTAAPDLE